MLLSVASITGHSHAEYMNLRVQFSLPVVVYAELLIELEPGRIAVAYPDKHRAPSTMGL